MDGAGGHLLTSEAIAEAISFCLTLARLQAELVMKGDWFFGVWQPDAVPSGVAFTDVSAEMLAENPSCWTLEQGASWHGFAGLGLGYCVLDPIKVTLTTVAWRALASWRIVDLASFGPVGRSVTAVRFFHFATVFWLIP